MSFIIGLIVFIDVVLISYEIFRRKKTYSTMAYKTMKGGEKIDKIKNKHLKQICLIWFYYDYKIKIFIFAHVMYFIAFVRF